MVCPKEFEPLIFLLRTYQQLSTVRRNSSQLLNVASYQRLGQMLRRRASNGEQRCNAGSGHKNGHPTQPSSIAQGKEITLTIYLATTVYSCPVF